MYLVIKKKEVGPYWPRLTSEKRRVPYIHTDFSRWKDEDEEASDDDSGPANDPSMQAVNTTLIPLLSHLSLLWPSQALLSLSLSLSLSPSLSLSLSLSCS